MTSTANRTYTYPNKGFLNTMQMANRYGISIQTLGQWPRYAGWPENARHRKGQDMMWDVAAVDAWLRTRAISKKGNRPRWLAVVGHPQA